MRFAITTAVTISALDDTQIPKARMEALIAETLKMAHEAAKQCLRREEKRLADADMQLDQQQHPGTFQPRQNIELHYPGDGCCPDIPMYTAGDAPKEE
jgi:hypothetical protein